MGTSAWAFAHLAVLAVCASTLYSERSPAAEALPSVKGVFLQPIKVDAKADLCTGAGRCGK